LTLAGRTGSRCQHPDAAAQTMSPCRPFLERLSLCASAATHYHCDVNDMNVFCFAEREHAERFRERFGGEFLIREFAPSGSTRRRGFPTNERAAILAHGPLRASRPEIVPDISL
jgi:hypothetical protein